MKQGKSLGKGHKYEIKISRVFSRWYRPNDNTDHFWRTAASGAKATLTRKAETPFVGDITFLPNPNSLLPILEVKDRKTVTFNNINTKTFLPTVYYEETVEKAKKIGIGKPVWIIFKIYHFETDYIYLNKATWETDPLYPSISRIICPEYFDFFLSTQKFTIVTLKEFLTTIPRTFILGEEK